MYVVNIKEAEHQLAKLVNDAAGGKDIIITSDDGTSIQLVPVPPKKVGPTFGSAKGKIKIADNFDDPLDEFEPYAP